jgi:tetratricopeptide (TPR) repeat protein
MALIAQDARLLALEGDWPGCVLAWDDILNDYPDFSEGYYRRSDCYVQMARRQRSFAEFEGYIQQALQDIDHAIALGGDQIGNYYFQRYRVYENWAGAGGAIAERLPLQQLALENLQQALASGTGSPVAHRSLPYALINAGQCPEALAEAQRLLDAIEPGDSPSGSINQEISQSYLCLGQYDEALDYIRVALAILDEPGWRFQEALILYSLGLLDESLSELNDLIASDPYFFGSRYYLRALIHYDQGHPDLAEEDLWLGAANVWGIDELGALVSGLLARDAGDKLRAIDDLTRAVATLDQLNQLFLDRAIRELRGLGVEPPILTLEPPVQATAMPTVTVPPPGQSWVTPIGEELYYSLGSGLLHLSSGGWITIHFVPRDEIEVVDATELRISVEFEGDQRPTDLKIYVWQPRTNIWTMLDFEGAPIQVGNPGRFVLPDGGLVVAPLELGDGSAVLNLVIHLEVQLADGSQVTLGIP